MTLYRSKVRLLAITLIVWPLVLANPAVCDEVAIARCSRTGVVSVGRGSDTDQAATAAVTNCLAKGGQLVCCQSLISSREDVCVALAVGNSNQVRTGSGETRAIAIENALSECYQCTISAALCAQ
jgi:hypothetical protein